MLNLLNKEEFKLCCYRSEEIKHIWHIAKPMIEKALDQGSNYTIDEVHWSLLAKQMQLWMWGHEAALVTAIQEKGGQKFCLLLALAGKGMSEWFKYLPLVEDWAKDQGATQMRVYGRPGWARQTGYDIAYCKLVKEI